MISAVVLTHNNQDQLSLCLKSLEWCDEIIVVDDNSSDNTVAIAKKLGVRVFLHALNNDFASQRNFGISKSQGNWYFFVDSDEIVSPQLAEEIKAVIGIRYPTLAKQASYKIKRQDWFLGKKLKFGETNRNWLIRLVEKGSGHWTGKVHEVWQTRKPVGKLKNKLNHQQNDSIESFFNKINYYSSVRAKEIFEKGQCLNHLKLLIWPIGKFIHNYLVKLGFLDGFPGLALALLMSFHSLSVRIKLYGIKEE